jgi:osmoprotectant transport system substrate-binding protein
MIRKTTKGLIPGLALLVAVLAPFSAGACVGKTLVIGSTGTLQQEILAQMLSILISERTGTTIKVVAYDSTLAAHEALMKADLDMYVEYTGVGQAEILRGEMVTDPEALYQAVKRGYNRDLNLVWLKPLGFDEPRVVPAGVPAQAAPVVRKDTLKKFPALARLIDKLGGAIDAEAMKKLETEAGKENAHEVARRFLKDNRLI